MVPIFDSEHDLLMISSVYMDLRGHILLGQSEMHMAQLDRGRSTDREVHLGLLDRYQFQNLWATHQYIDLQHGHDTRKFPVG